MRYFKHVKSGHRGRYAARPSGTDAVCGETKTLGQIAAEAKTLAKSAIDGSIIRTCCMAGTFYDQQSRSLRHRELHARHQSAAGRTAWL
jgi:hypothetical protein